MALNLNSLVWNQGPEFLEAIKDHITPVEVGDPLRIWLAEDYPSNCSNLPIGGGWGYTKDDAIIFIRDQFKNPGPPDFVSLEYFLVHKIVYYELINTQDGLNKFSGIDISLSKQGLSSGDDKKYDSLEFNISCYSDLHWALLKYEWETNDNGTRKGFDVDSHFAKKASVQINYQRTFWFDITDVFGS